MTTDHQPLVRGALVRGETRPELAELFLSSSGRMSRIPFIAAMAMLLGLFALFDLHAMGLARALTGWLVDFALFCSACCLLSKRLHDRGRAGWWSGAAMLAFALAWPRAEGVLGWMGLAVVLVFVFDLAVMPGQARANRFGPAGERA